MVDRIHDVAGESSTHILTESESGQWQHALITAADVFDAKAKELRQTILGQAGDAAIERIAVRLDAQAKQAREAAALLADADRVEIVRTAPEGGAA